MDYEAMDKAALYNARLGLKICPNCTADLNPVALYDDVWGCEGCRESWHVPDTDGIFRDSITRAAEWWGDQDPPEKNR